MMRRSLADLRTCRTCPPLQFRGLDNHRRLSGRAPCPLLLGQSLPRSLSSPTNRWGRWPALLPLAHRHRRSLGAGGDLPLPKVDDAAAAPRGRRGRLPAVPAHAVRAPPLLLPVWRWRLPRFHPAPVAAFRVDSLACTRPSFLPSYPSFDLHQVEVISCGQFGFAPGAALSPRDRQVVPLCSRVGLSFWSADVRCRNHRNHRSYNPHMEDNEEMGGSSGIFRREG